VYDECLGGKRMCGPCKQEAAGLVKKFLEAHRKKRDSLMKEAEALLARSRDYLGAKGS
jgi:tryptophanyl-tRNA synthetase